MSRTITVTAMARPIEPRSAIRVPGDPKTGKGRKVLLPGTPDYDAFIEEQAKAEAGAPKAGAAEKKAISKK